MKILWAVENPEAATTRYRTTIPGKALRDAHQIEVISDMPLDEARDFKYDLLMLQRTSSPSAFALCRTVQSKGVACGYDMDDNIFQIDEDNPVFGLYLNQPNIPWAQVMTMRFADAVTVSTSPLAKTYSILNPKVAVLPNCIDFAAWRRPVPEISFGDKIPILWGGSNTHRGSLAMLAPVIAEILDRFPQAFFVFQGMEPPFPLPLNRYTTFGFSTYANYQILLTSAAIGIAPLEPTRFNGSKSDLRLKEYAAAGLAIVASNFGPYTIASEFGAACSSGEEWVAALAHYLENAALRREKGQQALEWARTWDINLHAHLFDKVWTEIAQKGASHVKPLGAD